MANTIIGEKRVGSARLRSSNGVPVLDETYEYTIRSDNKDNSRYTILDTTQGMPVINVSTSSYGLTICRAIDIKRRDANPLIWDATVEYSSEVTQNQGDIGSDPESWRPVYETKFERLEELVTQDLDGTAVVNSAGQAYASALTISRFIPYWEFYQFESPAISDEVIIARNEKINNEVFKGRAAESLLVTVMSSVLGFYYGYPRRLTQYSLKYNSRLWTHKRLDVGTHYIENGVFKPFTDAQQNLRRGNLNGNGGQAAIGDPPATNSFDIYPKISFSFLRI